MHINDSVTVIKGVGPVRAEQLKKLRIYTIKDLICHIPRDFEDRRKITPIIDTDEDGKFLVIGKIVREGQLRFFKGLSMTKITVEDKSGTFDVIFFNMPYLKNYFKLNKRYVFYGKVTLKKDNFIMEMPEFTTLDAYEADKNKIIPIYPLTKGISQKILRGILEKTIEQMDEVEETLPAYIVEKYRLESLSYSIRNIHFPEDDDAFLKARKRLVYDELFIVALGLKYMKHQKKEVKKGIIFADLNYEPYLNILPFTLTSWQQNAVEDLISDLQKGYTMNRLLQGDVGSGKTAVCGLLSYIAVKNGYQTVLMAPTDVLATQHYIFFKAVFEDLGYHVAILTGAMKQKEKKEALKGIEEGYYSLIIGTHALIEDRVKYHNVGVVITDEQHRFGVNQRGKLISKASCPHVLVMTATPIPRTLGIVLYGDLDISTIKGLPEDRQKIDTHFVNASYRDRMYHFIKDEIANGRQCYMVCPMIEESEKLDVNTVSSYLVKMREVFQGYKVEMLHGKMKAEEKADIMHRFKQGIINILVSTTVIEVGINVPNATVMVIENAERFGITQLHQLRGRVGRGAYKSYCILVSDTKSKIGVKRLKAVEKSNDGFYISEMDMELRGSGDFFGTRQHGLPDFKIANLYRDIDILEIANKACDDVLLVDANLSRKEHKHIKQLIKDKLEMAVLL